MQVFKDFLPIKSIPYVEELLCSYQIEIKIKSERKTRHGDFRVLSNGNCLITVNSNLNKYRFLITLIHEITHLYIYKLYKNSVKPHGEEWKNQFRILISPVLNPDIFPKALLPFLANYFKNPKASTDSDIELVKKLKMYDLKNDKNYIHELDFGRRFSIYNGKIFKLEKKLRKRYKCIEIETSKYYLFNANAEVNILD
ncbi:SprT-like domain-containing protein [Flavobacteriaceae bacterium]|jgi:SprT protein|nr:SprT-like domain-containing protein [Flavobacteriaceae bacterium]MDB9712421.1 SprT-like domain-containing protein [Flavobacteriaceae bacterium]